VKDANSSTRIKAGDKKPRAAPRPAAPGDEHRAQPNSERHRINQEELGVTEEHLTEDMKNKRRGTFP
jgi:hypothetical protein